MCSDCEGTIEIVHHFPQRERVTDIVDEFLKTWGIPQCCGAVDGSHMPISTPIMNHTDYYNGKGFYSMVVQAVVDIGL